MGPESPGPEVLGLEQIHCCLANPQRRVSQRLYQNVASGGIA